MSTTKLIEDEYKGSKFLKVMGIDDEGRESKKPIVACGLVKLEALLDHLPEIQEWVSKNTKRCND